MIERHGRRSRTLALTIRKRESELEVVKAKSLDARKVMADLKLKVKNIADDIADHENIVSKSIASDVSFNPDFLYSAQLYIDQQQHIYKETMNELKRARQKVELFEKELRDSTLEMKGMVRVKEKSDRFVQGEIEKIALDRNMELWLMRQVNIEVGEV
ncbi:hypothetical protein KQ940_06590 [Marinobacterium sp. D7]|uniref:hypothetical protein n=1 Tax=Marinobacterium ramblicola TaxID=2849041 RepID=UPI001C2D88F2|nr:hypothetical protein [Marinobacterium ramblicola]MBV1787721.1 hypothetical protein [Marinobacterium ramblicola]